MRFIHSADWHLGKRLLGHSLLDEQAHALDELERLCVARGADALVVAGDIYDRSVPPVEAVSLLDDFLARMSQRAKIPVILLSGNHDSAARLGFGAHLWRDSGVHLGTKLSERDAPVAITTDEGTALFYLLPFLEPEQARAEIDEQVHGHDAAVAAALQRVQAHAGQASTRHGKGVGRVLVGHLFCVGGQESPDSERPLSAGGAGHVSPSTLTHAPWDGGWDYVALGHLHRPQVVAGRDHVRYSGSLLKYSVDEHTQPKAVLQVDIDLGREPGRSGERTSVEVIELSKRRDVVVLEDRFEALLTGDAYAAHAADFVAAYYTDATYVLHAAERLRERFPHLLQALPKRVQMVQSESTHEPAARTQDAPSELLSAFWSFAEVGHDLEAEHLALFEELLHQAQKESV